MSCKRRRFSCLLVLATLIAFLSPFSCVASETTPLTSRLARGLPGHFIVFSQSGFYHLLLIRSITDQKVTFEEISVEQTQVKPETINWKEWVWNKAPGASSWISMTLDLEAKKIIQCFSYLEKQWLIIQDAEPLLIKLLSLTLRPTADSERKRVGPAPSGGEKDRRKLWKPSMKKEGKLIKKGEFEVLRAVWPKDSSYLAGSVIELYLDQKDPSFPFPYFLEIQSPHYTFKLRAIDSGTDLHSPAPSLMAKDPCE